MQIPNGYVPNKEHITQLVAVLRQGDWQELDALLRVPHWDANETRLAIDVLHYAGCLRSRTNTYNGLLMYQWIVQVEKKS